MFLFIPIPRTSLPPFWNLNTSHVLIYLLTIFSYLLSFLLFKYISCSYLSGGEKMYYITYSKFKYISCSYLSKHGDPEQPKDIKFKYISCSYLSFRWNNPTTVFIYLNTSHVLIYHTYC